MNEEAKRLFLDNYYNRGDCEGLLEKTKIIEKEFRRTGQVKIIKYLHWALVERLFRLQGGTFEVKNWNFGVPFVSNVQSYDENGELTTKEETQTAFFLHLSATWQGETLEEHYPIFDNQTSKIIALPDAQDLNTAKQRGMVRLIARISGIGLSIFEQLDDQFGKEDDSNKTVVAPQQSKVIENVEKNKKPEKKLNAEKIISTPVENKKLDTEKNVYDSGVFLEMMKGEKVAVNPVPTPAPVVNEVSKETEEYADKKLAIKKYIPTHQKIILEFMATKGVSLLGDLSFSELVELENIVKNA